MPQMTEDVRMIAAIQQSENQPSNILKTTQQLLNEYSVLLSDADIHKVAASIGNASEAVLDSIDGNRNKEIKDLVFSPLKYIIQNMDDLIKEANLLASKCENPEKRSNLENAIYNCEIAKSDLLATTKLMLSTINKV